MQVKILYFDGCPHYGLTLALVKQVVTERGVDARVESVHVDDATDAERLRFLGSPTVQVDGADIEPAARSRTGYAYSCRMYAGSGTPPKELIDAAIGKGHERDSQ